MSNLGYSPKDIKFDEEGREKLFNGIATISKAVKSTLGPSGQTVLIESPHHTHGITVTKDGVTVARSIELLDPIENLAVRMMKEAADRTATSAGDGTTTAIVLTEALVKAGFKHIVDGVNKTQVLRDMVTVTNSVVDSLKTNSRKVSNSTLANVAIISANNDIALGKTISDVYKKVGKNGIVTIANSQTSETYYETTNGLKIDRGYMSNLFVTDHKKDDCVFEDTYILVSDAEINNLLAIENVLKPIINEGKKLLIIAPCSQNVINTLAANVMKNGLKICAIQPPNFGYKQHELMQDIALTVGATYFSEKTGDDLSIMTVNDLGHAQKVIVERDSTVIVRDKESNNNTLINERVEQLWAAHRMAKKKADKEFILSRIASLSGGVGVIYVGGNTDLEQKELYDRVDDAVCAVRSALEEGILPGGGVALFKEAIKILSKNASEQSIAEKILAEALAAPMNQIFRNAGLKDVVMANMNYSYGLDVKNNVWGDMYSMGVIDPLKVTKSALQNAVSVAVTILSTNAIVTMARTYQAE